MNGGEVEIDVEISEEDYKRTLFWYSKTKLILLSVFGALLLAAFSFGAISMTLSRPEVSPFIFVPLVIPVLLIGFNIWQLIAGLQRQAKSIVSTTEPTTFLFSDTGMSSVSNSTSIQTAWTSFFKIQEIESDFIFFPQKDVFFPIPKRFFRNPEDIDSLRRFISENVSEDDRILIG